MARLHFMSLDSEELRVEVTLSRRNLQTLLAKLDTSWSARTITNNHVLLNGQRVEAGVLLVLRAEEDDEHYAKRGTPPGKMHPDTEARIKEMRSDGSD